MTAQQPTYQHGYGFEKGECLSILPSGATFDSRPHDAEKGIGCDKKAWEAHAAQNQQVFRKQGQDYSKLKVVQLQRLIAKRQVKINKGESLKDFNKADLVNLLIDWEQFKR
jgi:hypothetical protein